MLETGTLGFPVRFDEPAIAVALAPRAIGRLLERGKLLHVDDGFEPIARRAKRAPFSTAAAAPSAWQSKSRAVAAAKLGVSRS